MDFEANDFVKRAGLGLEAEDRLLLGSHLVQETFGGLHRLINERYFQFIVWRALAPKWSVAVEQDRFDLVVFDREEIAIFEMKLWMSSTGETEVSKIKSDIEKLRRKHAAIRGIMLFSANERGDCDENCEWIESKIGDLPRTTRHTHCFDTFDRNNLPIEFWLGLWLI